MVVAAGANGCYVIDRRQGERRVLALLQRPTPQRPEVDDLIAAACAATLGQPGPGVCNPFPGDGAPEEAYETIVANARAAAEIAEAVADELAGRSLDVDRLEAGVSPPARRP